MSTTTPADPLLTILLSIQSHDLRILHLSESITAAFPDATTRSSDASDSLSSNTPTPAALQADLSHYKELFSKLRFSYLEQVTKEKFLRAITEDAPLVVEAGENEELEEGLLVAKGELRKSKREVEGILAELEGLSRRLVDDHKTILSQISQATTLPQQTEEMEVEIAALENEQNPYTTCENGMPKLPLSDTLTLISAHEAELARLQKELAEAELALPKKRARLQALEGEIGPLEMDKEGLEKFASEAVRMRDFARVEGKVERESMGRWYKAVCEGLEGVLGR
ncbi:hypothetical protein L873DRAFT_1803678 [Choiromyces venosus 120613-1]|uniref:Kinetochore protein Sos7 coiled-coil domain-containing protein n=1 Tax=Choiromyces venosus 120613-1 TaxID=1336337 RepID=A0A3N4JXB9_9PEZI|nr:hypothetical protein L873DRAFT_1803678 [Choiromyces venosus 120613-1]